MSASACTRYMPDFTRDDVERGPLRVGVADGTASKFFDRDRDRTRHHSEVLNVLKIKYLAS